MGEMVATFLQDDLVKELRKIFEDFPLKSPKGGLSKVSVFSQYLPVPKPSMPPLEDLDPVLVEEGLAASNVAAEPQPCPYIIVRVEDGKIDTIEGDQTIEVYLLIGVYDDDLNNQGYKDVLNIIQKIYERFSKNPILSRMYECVMPIEWAMQEEESYPYYVGGMSLNFITCPIRREDPYA